MNLSYWGYRVAMSMSLSPWTILVVQESKLSLYYKSCGSCSLNSVSVHQFICLVQFVQEVATSVVKIANIVVVLFLAIIIIQIGLAHGASSA